MMTKSLSLALAALVTAAALGSVPTAHAAGEAGPTPPRQTWTFGGLTGYFDNNQLRRGYTVYKEVCASCHGLKRIAFRHLVEKGGPELDEEGAKNLASTFQVVDGPNDDGKMFKRPARLTDRLPSPFSNDNEARSANNGALPPDLSLITMARSVHEEKPAWKVPFAMVKDIVTAYQESGSDYVYALLNGYEDAPKGVTVGDGLNYNKYFPGFQIAMANPFAGGDGLVKYPKGPDGKPEAPETVAQYTKDVTAFLAWAGDPKLEERKRMGPIVMIYLLITTLLLYGAKRRLWKSVH
jgi:ubiquinol-cytochrome c reductase cytochrome c1 subunit